MQSKTAIVAAFLFTIQGVIFTFLIFFATIYINKVLQVSVTTLSLVIFFVMLPYYLKVLFGLAVDFLSERRFGSKKHLVMLFSLSQSVVWYFLPKVRSIIPFSFMMLLAVVCFSFIDSCLDAYVLGLVSKERRGPMWGLSWAMRGVGGVLFSVLAGHVAYTYGWELVFSTLFLSAVSMAAAGLFIHEPRPPGGLRNSMRALKKVFRWICPYLAMAFFIANWIPLGIGVWMYGPLLSSFLGISIEYAGLASCLASLGNLFGSFLSVAIVFHLNPWKAWKLTVVVYAASCLLLLLNNGDISIALITAFLYGIGRGFVMGNGLSIGGELIVSSLRATMLALYSSSIYLGFSIGGLFSGFFIHMVGYEVNLTIAALGMIPTSLLLIPVKRSKIIAVQEA